MEMIIKISLQHGETKQGVMEVVQSDKKLCLFPQKLHMRNIEYIYKIKAHVEVIDAYRGEAEHHPKMEIGIVKETGIDIYMAQYAHKEASAKKGRRKYLVCLFIRSAYNALCHYFNKRL